MKDYNTAIKDSLYKIDSPHDSDIWFSIEDKCHFLDAWWFKGNTCYVIRQVARI